MISEPVAVSPFEADLLTILYGILGLRSRGEWLPRIGIQRERPARLRGAAIELIEAALSQGITLHFARAGWRRERFLRGERTAEGRLWERSPPAGLGLEFSERTMELLLQMTAGEALSKKKQRGLAPLTDGDRWLHTAAYEAVRGLPLAEQWREQTTWRSDPWYQLHFAADFAVDARDAELLFAPLLTARGAAFLEASQAKLADLWVEAELSKAAVTTAPRLLQIAAAQDRVLTAFFAAIDRVGRRDLSRFFLQAAARLLRPQTTSRTFLAALKVEGRLADRQRAQRAGLNFLTHFSQLAAWQTLARATGYWDEGYAAAQLWKSDWETYNGDESAVRARRILAEVI